MAAILVLPQRVKSALIFQYARRGLVLITSQAGFSNRKNQPGILYI